MLHVWFVKAKKEAVNFINKEIIVFVYREILTNLNDNKDEYFMKKISYDD